MKRPLKPSEVPPGSVVRQHSWTQHMWDAVIAITATHIYAGVIGQRHTRKVTFESLAREYQILRPGEDWQPCYVEEFSVSDYKPGQEVDDETARKLHDAGVAVEYCLDDGWHRILHLFRGGYNPPSCIRYRLAPVKRNRNIRPDELPERFIIEGRGGLFRVVDRAAVTLDAVMFSAKAGDKWSRSLDGPWNKFTVEE